MRSRLQISLFAALASAGLCTATYAHAADQPAAKSEEAQILFANHGGIYDWQADGENGLYIQGRNRNDWYYAKLFSPCIDLPWVERIGFEPEPTDTFDKFSAIVVKGHKCMLTSLTRSDPPPDVKARADKKAAEKAAKEKANAK